MNNHGIVCKNNIMIIFFILLISIILILINKKVKFCLDFSVIGFEYNFCININYFWDILTLYKEDILRYKDNLTNKKEYSSKPIEYKWILDYIDIDRINFETKIGLEDVFITSMSIPLVSSVIAIILEKYFSKTLKKFSVKPIYNKLFFSLKGVTYISIKLKDIIYIILKLWRKHKKDLANMSE